MERKPLFNIKRALFEANETQKALSKKTKIAESTLSQATRGRVNLRPDEKAKIASALGRCMSELFSDDR